MPDLNSFSSWTTVQKQAMHSAMVNTFYVGDVAAGDGVTIDTQAINQVLTDAGDGATIIFDTLKTFLSNGPIYPRTGQTLLGIGSTLKRANQAQTTTSTTIASGVTTTFNVASTAGFTVGCGVIVYQGTAGSWTNHTNTLVCTAVGVSSITVDVAPNVSLSGTTQVITGGHQAILVNDDVSIKGLGFDGNKANNDSNLVRWELISEINSIPSTTGVSVEDTVIRDAACEGIFIGGASVVKGNRITNSNGNAIHFSSLQGSDISSNHIDGANLYGADAGHQDGCISSSNLNFNVNITNNYLANSQFAGVGGLGSGPDDQKFIISNNTMVSCAGGGVELSGTAAPLDSSERIKIHGNTFDDCGPMVINSGSTSEYTDGYGNNRHTILNNDFINGSILTIAGSFNIAVKGNLFDLSGNTTDQALVITNSKRITVKANDFIGGLNHIRVQKSGSPSGVVTQVSINNNDFYDSVNDSVYVTSAANVVGEYVKVGNNTFKGGASTLQNSPFIQPDARCYVTGNTFTAKDTAHNRLITAIGVCVITNNTVLGAGTNDIRLLVGAAGCVCSNNQVSTVVDDQTGGGSGIRDNDIIAA